MEALNILLIFFSDIPFYIHCVIERLVLFFTSKKRHYKDISKETVLITGASSGIGRELAIDFAKCGVRLVLLDINFKSLNETKDLISTESTCTDVYIYECDLSDRSQIYSTAVKIKDEVGIVTILINNAGIATGKKFMDCADDMIKKTMDINIMAHFWMCKAFLPDMKATNHGHIVFVSSLAGFIPAYRMTDYCASKYAVVGFQEALRLELEEEGFNGIKTTIVAPVFVNTGLFKSTKFESLALKPLNVNWVSKQILSAVLSNQEVLFLPEFYGYFFSIFKALMPRKAYRRLAKSTKLTECLKSDDENGTKPIKIS